MIKQTLWAVIAAGSLAACDVAPVGQSPTTPVPAPSGAPAMSPNQAARSFVRVVQTLEPVAERECRARTSGVNCDFNIVVDDRPGQPANAFQTLDKNGRPVVAFTMALIADARNEDELAFVLGHEAAHHIGGHIARQQQNAVAGAVIFAGLATLSGGGAEAVRSAQKLGAQVGARSYSKDFELEADALGTIITKRAGYDPLRGAQFFTRIPDPGDKFLGTHPPNASRIDVVRRTVAGL
ncbi:M48 family metalloprotease [Sulfitobacter sp. M57]|uniref:M48 family metallopeptidase n=1 Tax=unclassified Sulfitobacter TaxID=196795 RepID=UPI0023E13E30|nr:MULTISPECIES: M48 family metallopeptidase [unclassified Sulfitobacter]MDF3412896.1 M48 family metalloprotease [Sulfitobacter sp. KE5]MDF3421820.1 M48 family metalloprotease [Sulfitobacter sp. KE43]MDF3431445.1 M48 family metalloprotease [Sulfitobacter sp. KE42]MDF3457086.1 M48 family metalloprotease [Sulfitobacter sp. S74]MDF3460989.1 M48 family metalloprotease [Sulfitobacter sp. Ks18]